MYTSFFVVSIRTVRLVEIMFSEPQSISLVISKLVLVIAVVKGIEAEFGNELICAEVYAGTISGY